MGGLFQSFRGRNGVGEETEISRNWATARFLIFDGQPWNCHGASGCVI